MPRSWRRTVGLAAAMLLPALMIGPISSAGPVAAATAAPECGSPSIVAPVLTGYGVMSAVSCTGTGTNPVSVTCVEMYATWLGYSAFVPVGGGENCNSNGVLLDFAPCSLGTHRYRTMAGAAGGPAGLSVGYSNELSIRC